MTEFMKQDIFEFLKYSLKVEYRVEQPYLENEGYIEVDLYIKNPKDDTWELIYN